MSFNVDIIFFTRVVMYNVMDDVLYARVVIITVFDIRCIRLMFPCYNVSRIEHCSLLHVVKISEVIFILIT